MILRMDLPGAFLGPISTDTLYTRSLTIDCEELTAAAVYRCYLHYHSKLSSSRAAKAIISSWVLRNMGTGWICLFVRASDIDPSGTDK